MAQRSNLRFVHCPKCASLLQELHGCSVFKCGACGAVLRAKKREPASDGGNSAETTESIVDTRECERESYDGNAKNGRILSSGARADDSIVNSAMDKREGSAHHQRNYSRDKSAGLRLDRRRANDDTACAFDYRQRPEDRVSKIVERGSGVNSPQFRHDLETSGAERERWSFTGDHFEGFLRDSRIVTEREGTRRPLYPEEGPSNYYGSPSSFGYGEFLDSRDDVTARDRVIVLERERVELITKLDELANQINQSSNMGNRLGAEEIVCHRKSIASGDSYYAPAGYDILNEPLVLESPIRKPPHSKLGRESVSSMESHEMETLNSYFSPRDGQLNLFENPRRSFLPGTMRPFHQYPHRPPNRHLPDEYMGFDRDPSVMYPNQHLHHHPSCTCSSCYHKYGRVPPPQFSLNASSSSKTFKDQFDSNLYRRVNPVKIKPQNTRQSGDGTSSSNSKYLHPLQMWPGDPDTDTEDFVWSQRKRPMVSRQNRKHYHPIAGAAPFIACLNCLELLKLPRELIIKEKYDKQKFRCGGCSAIILFKIENKKLVTSMKKGSCGGAVKDGGNDIQVSSTCSDFGGINSDTCASATRTSSDPYNVSSKRTLARDDSLLEVQPQNASESGKMQGLQSPASSSPSFCSEEEDSPDIVIAQCNVRAVLNTSPKSQNSQVPEHFDKSSINGNENSRMNQEGVSPVKDDTCQSTRDDASTMTELEVPLNDYLHTGLSLLEVQPQNASDSGKMQGLHSLASSPSFRSEEGESLDNVIAHSNVLTRSKNNISSKLQNSHVQKRFDNSSSYENEKIRMDQEGVSVEKNDACQSMRDDASTTAEVEVPLNEDFHTEISQDSTDTSKEAKDKVKKRSKSFLADLTKSHGEFQSLDNGKPKVSVNGHPIADDIVKMAEKLAGPVLPGDYWYDFRAGFWGVMNQPCLGIIPPFIEEFKHLLPENCAAGNTSIFINGRELNQRDLDLLASRGLPRTRNRFYAIDISGIVLDEKTGEVLYNLGKLAPTVERAQRGFGMRVPEEV